MSEQLVYSHRIGFDCVIPENCVARIESGNVIAIYLPDEKPWNGDGFPPLGVEFEWRYGGHAWKKGVALYIGSVYVILKASDHEQHYYLREIEFRPIRTAEQLAADAHRAKYMPELVRLWEADTARNGFLEAVYAMIAEAHKS